MKTKILDSPLDPIVPNGKVEEQRSEQRKEQVTPPTTSIPKVPSKDNPNEHSPKESFRDK